jgi:FkbM family methyltransferase
MGSDFIAEGIVQAAKCSPLGRGAARKWMLGLLTRLHPEPILGDFRGVPILFHLDNTTEKKALLRDAYDAEELDFLVTHLRGRPGTFVDIGANSGLYSIYIAAQMPRGSRVIAVEPNPQMCGRIKKNAELLRSRGQALDVSIEIQACALGEGPGTLYLDLSEGLGGAHLVSGPAQGCVPVPVETLANLCRQNRVASIQALKIDVEGYEDRVLLPFLKECGPQLLPGAVVMEYVHRNGWITDAAAACLSAGYRVSGKTRSSLLMELP